MSRIAVVLSPGCADREHAPIGGTVWKTDAALDLADVLQERWGRSGAETIDPC